MASVQELERTLSLIDYRRRVARIYHEVLSGGADVGTWRRWADARSELLRTHPRSPLDATHRASPDSVRYFDHDPTWRVVATVHPPEADTNTDTNTDTGQASLNEKHSTFRPIGSVAFERAGAEHRLRLFQLDAYGGGLFLPFGDATNGVSTYGGGRYLLDGAKSADLGSPGPGRLVLDFNYAYHPSCMWDPIWPCPLAPPFNRLDVEVEAGEREPAPPTGRKPPTGGGSGR